MPLARIWHHATQSWETVRDAEEGFDGDDVFWRRPSGDRSWVQDEKNICNRVSDWRNANWDQDCAVRCSDNGVRDRKIIYNMADGTRTISY